MLFTHFINLTPLYINAQPHHMLKNTSHSFTVRD